MSAAVSVRMDGETVAAVEFQSNQGKFEANAFESALGQMARTMEQLEACLNWRRCLV